MEQEHGRMEVGEDLRNEIRRGGGITVHRSDTTHKRRRNSRLART